MKDAVIVSVLSVLPRNRGAYAMGAMARTGLSRWACRAFVRAYRVNMDEAEHPIERYPTLEALFTRRLAAGARPIDADADAMVSPVDGRCAFVGPATAGAVEVAPGRHLDLAELLGVSPDAALDAAVLYLSPQDYHRVHVPREGQARAWSYVPGTLWPVFPAAVRRVDGLFARNERMVVHLDTSQGPLDVVLVGAFGVGRISCVVTDAVSNDGQPAARGELTPPKPLGRGDDLGVFHLGSTVILCAPTGRWAWSVQPGEVVRLGRPIARAR